MTATLFKMEQPRHKMTPDEFKKRLAALGPDKKQATVRWEHGLAELFYESDWTQRELAECVGMAQSRVSEIVSFGLWINIADRDISSRVSENKFRTCWKQTAKGKNARLDVIERCLLVTPLIEKELAKPKQQRQPKLTPSKTEAVTLQSLVKPGRWDEAKKLIDVMAMARAREMTVSLQSFYTKQTAEAKAAKAEYNRLARKLNQIMTQAEYRLIRSCLHPDKQEESERKKYDRAFEIFNRIGEPIVWN
jgi:transcriptional regulator with XRE-family HTH domain